MFFKKQTSLLFIVLIFSVILTSCTPNDNSSNGNSTSNNESNILIPQVRISAPTKENYALPMTKERFLAFKEGKRSFILLASSERCTFCQELEPLLVNYVNEYKFEIYKLEGTSTEVTNNFEFYTNELEPESTIRTPTIYIFDNGRIVKRELGTGKLKTRKEVITFFDQYIRKSNYYALAENQEINEEKSAVYFKFDFDNKLSQSLVNNNFYPLFSKKTIVYLIDEDTRVDLEISFNKHEETFTFDEKNSDLTAALAFFTTNFS